MFNLENARYTLSALLAYSKSLKSDYQAKRQIMDIARIGGSWRPYTHAKQRLDSIKFIEDLTQFVMENRYNYRSTIFTDRTYTQVVEPLLIRIILGAYMLELINITQSYSSETSVKNDSALGFIILNFFEIEKLSDIPKEIQSDCLASLRSYLTKIPEKEVNPSHPTKNRDNITAEISSALKMIVPHPGEPSILERYFRFS